MGTKYQEIYQRSIKDPEGFWADVANDIFWYKKPSKILNSENPPFYKWFKDGTTNTCYNAIDLHIKNGNGEKLAIIYDSPITNSQKKITYSQLKDQVAIFAGALENQGITSINNPLSSLQQGYARHIDQNALLEQALTDNRITEDQYKRMGGYNVLQNAPSYGFIKPKRPR